MNSQHVSQIGYILSISVGDFIYLGGAMVTDSFGLPVEFRYTEPVKASRLQRILYGGVLERFVHRDVIVANLLERLEQSPGLMVVSDPDLLDCVDGNGRIGLWLGETRLPRLPDIGAVQEVAIGEILLQAAESGHPIRVKMSESNSVAGTQRETAKRLVEMSETMDLLEPLRRVESAVRLIWEETPEAPLGYAESK
jgi:hypothetical protein